jgi:hypothetical protein
MGRKNRWTPDRIRAISVGVATILAAIGTLIVTVRAGWC